VSDRRIWRVPDLMLPRTTEDDHFFFSSRRRHTRSYGDWSSDVCSSDLMSRAPASLPPAVHLRQHLPGPLVVRVQPLGDFNLVGRSEERRVGEECECRWWLWSSIDKPPKSWRPA